MKLWLIVKYSGQNFLPAVNFYCGLYAPYLPVNFHFKLVVVDNPSMSVLDFEYAFRLQRFFHNVYGYGYILMQIFETSHRVVMPTQPRHIHLTINPSRVELIHKLVRINYPMPYRRDEIPNALFFNE